MTTWILPREPLKTLTELAEILNTTRGKLNYLLSRAGTNKQPHPTVVFPRCKTQQQGYYLPSEFITWYKQQISSQPTTTEQSSEESK
jgi:hypothetical protein